MWGQFDLCWALEPQVNILSGTNGSGKSTVLQALGNLFGVGHLTEADLGRMEGMAVSLGDDGTRVSSARAFDPSKYRIGTVSSQPTTTPQQRRALYDLLDELFALTGKRVVRDGAGDEFLFRLDSGLEIGPGQLSSGENHILDILAQVVSYGGKPFTLILDEPEISLHFDWQKRLIEDILGLNPDAQLVLATHSPAVVMHGWIDRITDIGELLQPIGTVQL